MPKVIITHDVADVDSWLKGKTDRVESVSAMGGSDVVDHVAQDGSNKVAVSGMTLTYEALVPKLKRLVLTKNPEQLQPHAAFTAAVSFSKRGE